MRGRCLIGSLIEKIKKVPGKRYIMIPILLLLMVGFFVYRTIQEFNHQMENSLNSDQLDEHLTIYHDSGRIEVGITFDPIQYSEADDSTGFDDYDEYDEPVLLVVMAEERTRFLNLITSSSTSYFPFEASELLDNPSDTYEDFPHTPTFIPTYSIHYGLIPTEVAEHSSLPSDFEWARFTN